MTWLDGTMIANAKDANDRIWTLFYLLQHRYGLDAKRAGYMLKRDYSDDPRFQTLLQEVRNALATKDPSLLRLPSLNDVTGIRYLEDMLVEYDSPGPKLWRYFLRLVSVIRTR